MPNKPNRPPQVRFYHGAQHPWQLACELVTRAYHQRRRLLLRFEQQEQAHQFDQLLWTFQPNTFIPHVLADSPQAESTPVLIDYAGRSGLTQQQDILFNFAAPFPQDYAVFRLLIEIISTDPAIVRPARLRWQHYKKAGCRLQAFDAESREAL